MQTAYLRPIYLPMGMLGERVVIALVGRSEAGGLLAFPVSERPLKCLSDEVSQSVTSFGLIVCADYLQSMQAGDAGNWQPPLTGLALGDECVVDGFDELDVRRIALSLCALRTEPSEFKERQVSAKSSPRTREEHRFLESVRREVTRELPHLDDAFCKPFSLTGTAYGGEIDFVGHHYATCFAAINPKAKGVARIQTATAALWRLARARDAFGFAAPASVELTAWVPPVGMPIYSDSDYDVCRQTVAELQEQAKREQLGLFSVSDPLQAGQRLVAAERISPNS